MRQLLPVEAQQVLQLELLDLLLLSGLWLLVFLFVGFWLHLINI